MVTSKTAATKPARKRNELQITNYNETIHESVSCLINNAIDDARAVNKTIQDKNV